MKKLSLSALCAAMLLVRGAAASPVDTTCHTFTVQGPAHADALSTRVVAEITAALAQGGALTAAPDAGEIVVALSVEEELQSTPGGRVHFHTCVTANVRKRGEAPGPRASGDAAPPPGPSDCSDGEAHDKSAVGKFGPSFDLKPTLVADIAASVNAVRALYSAGVAATVPAAGDSILFDDTSPDTVSTDAGTLAVRRCLRADAKVVATALRGQVKVGSSTTLYARSSVEPVDLFASLTPPGAEPESKSDAGEGLPPSAPPPHPVQPLAIGLLAAAALVGACMFIVLARSKLNPVLTYAVLLTLSLCAAVVCFAGLGSFADVVSEGVQLGGGIAGAVVFLVLGLNFVKRQPPAGGVNDAGAADVAAPADAPLSIVVTVLDEQSRAVTSGEVRLDDGSAPQPINRFGQVSFHGVKRKEARTLTATVPGYESEVVTTELAGPVTIHLSKRRAGVAPPVEAFTLTVRLRDTAGAPVKVGTMRLLVATQAIQGVARSDGTMTFEKVPPEVWGQHVQFVFEHKSWRATQESVLVDNVTATVRLKRA